MTDFARQLQFLGHDGFTLAAPCVRQTMTIEQIQDNLYGYLDDFTLLDFRFIRYPDQTITATATATAIGQVFECFGRCEFGALASDEQGSVWLLWYPTARVLSSRQRCLPTPLWHSLWRAIASLLPAFTA